MATLYLGWTLISIPLPALAAEVSPDYHERSRITGARALASTTGTLLVMALPLLLAYLADAGFASLTRVTINPDGSRWTGNLAASGKPNVFVFGDSFVFGSGINDEQTLSYLLQQAMPDRQVKPFALGGYSLTQAYLRFTSQLRESITAEDIIVLGYADFYDIRHV